MRRPYPFLDTDIVIRFLTGDDLLKQERSAVFFEKIKKRELTVIAPDTVIADAVYVLSSPRLYNKSRSETAMLLTPLVRLKSLRIKNRQAVLKALSLYATISGLDFGDALIITLMWQAGAREIYSFDTDFDKIAKITRLEP